MHFYIRLREYKFPTYRNTRRRRHKIFPVDRPRIIDFLHPFPPVKSFFFLLSSLDRTFRILSRLEFFNVYIRTRRLGLTPVPSATCRNAHRCNFGNCRQFGEKNGKGTDSAEKGRFTRFSWFYLKRAFPRPVSAQHCSRQFYACVRYSFVC